MRKSSPRLVLAIADFRPDSTQIELIALRGATDNVIWEYVRAHNLPVVTKEGDFRPLAFVRGTPPKIIWRQVSHFSTTSIATALRDSASETDSSFADRDAPSLSCDADGLAIDSPHRSCQS